MYGSSIRNLKFRKFFPTRPEGAEALSPGVWGEVRIVSTP
nr:MAG TPA: hypothetical protein [Caudoviricetes sp.]